MSWGWWWGVGRVAVLDSLVESLAPQSQAVLLLELAFVTKQLLQPRMFAQKMPNNSKVLVSLQCLHSILQNEPELHGFRKVVVVGSRRFSIRSFLEKIL